MFSVISMKMTGTDYNWLQIKSTETRIQLSLNVVIAAYFDRTTHTGPLKSLSSKSFTFRLYFPQDIWYIMHGGDNEFTPLRLISVSGCQLTALGNTIRRKQLSVLKKEGVCNYSQSHH